MDEELIAKKDLLELTGISYGQLYRWKRKGLIPDDWFIKRSSYTGQETFLPKEKVLSRIDKIKSMKEEVSLDDLAGLFSPAQSPLSLNAEELMKRNIVAKEVLENYLQWRGSDSLEEPQLSGVLNFEDVLTLYILNKLILAGCINLDEGRTLAETLGGENGGFGMSPAGGELYLIRKLGVFSCFAVSPPCEVVFDKGVRLIERIASAAAIEELKLLLV